mmetsp:Transcript_42857/g.105661  ORF Transcript_42857/g.105661 Transcript_42857/m.105661 type:complete len:417 (+) Transcript_42857:92-1342(+)
MKLLTSAPTGALADERLRPVGRLVARQVEPAAGIHGSTPTPTQRALVRNGGRGRHRHQPVARPSVRPALVSNRGRVLPLPAPAHVASARVARLCEADPDRKHLRAADAAHDLVLGRIGDRDEVRPLSRARLGTISEPDALPERQPLQRVFGIAETHPPARRRFARLLVEQGAAGVARRLRGGQYGVADAHEESSRVQREGDCGQAPAAGRAPRGGVCFAPRPADAIGRAELCEAVVGAGHAEHNVPRNASCARGQPRLALVLCECALGRRVGAQGDTRVVLALCPRGGEVRPGGLCCHCRSFALRNLNRCEKIPLVLVDHSLILVDHVPILKIPRRRESDLNPVPTPWRFVPRARTCGGARAWLASLPGRSAACFRNRDARGGKRKHCTHVRGRGSGKESGRESGREGTGDQSGSV